MRKIHIFQVPKIKKVWIKNQVNCLRISNLYVMLVILHKIWKISVYNYFSLDN